MQGLGYYLFYRDFLIGNRCRLLGNRSRGEEEMTRQLKVHTVMRRDFGAILATTRLSRADEATLGAHRSDSDATVRRQPGDSALA
jgi:hypothetical protein